MKQQRSRASSPLRADELSIFCLQLSLMEKAGFSSAQSLEILARESVAPRERALLERLFATVDRGLPLSDALRDAGGFPPYMLNMISIGEASGRLEQVLSALAAYYRGEWDRRETIRAAVFYPSVMLVLALSIIVALTSRVLPIFHRVFLELGVSMNPFAAALMNIGRACEPVALVAALCLLAMGLVAFVLSKTERGGAFFTRLFGRLFLQKKLGLSIAQSRFSSAMAMMVASGLPLDDALKRTEALLEDSVLFARVKQCRALMANGTGFPKAAEQIGIFSGLQARLLAAGFRAGLTDQALEELAARCEAQSDGAIARLVGSIEPALIVFLAAIVGLILLSVMLPLIGMMTSMGA